MWPALTEAMDLLRESWPAQKALWSRLETRALDLAPLDETDAPRMRELAAVKSAFTYTVPANAIVVLTLETR